MTTPTTLSAALALLTPSNLPSGEISAQEIRDVVQYLDTAARSGAGPQVVLASELTTGALLPSNSASLNKLRLQAALDALEGTGTIIQLDQEGTFSFDPGIVWKSGVGLRGLGKGRTFLDKGAANLTNLIYTADARGTSAALASDAVVGDLSVTLASGHGITDGSWFVIGSTAGFRGMVTDDYGAQGELAFAESVSGNTITLGWALRDSYTTGNGSYAAPLNMLEGVSFEELTFQGTDQESSQSFGLQFYGLAFATFRDCGFRHLTDTAVFLFDCFGCLFENCTFEENWYSGTGTSYGIAITNASECNIVSNCYFRKHRHAVTMGTNANAGLPRRNHVIGCHFDKRGLFDVATIVTFRAASEHNGFWNCTYMGGPSHFALGMDGFHNVAIGGAAVSGGLADIGTGNAAQRTLALCDIRTSLLVQGITFDMLPGTQTFGLRVRSNGNTVSNCHLRGQGEASVNGYGLVALPQPVAASGDPRVSGDLVEDLRITDCTFENLSFYGMRLQGVKRFRARGFLILNCGKTTGSGYGIAIEDSPETNVSPVDSDDIELWGDIVDTASKMNAALYTENSPTNLRYFLGACEGNKSGYADTFLSGGTVTGFPGVQAGFW